MTTETKKTESKSFFSCCTAGNEDKNKQVYVNMDEKKVTPQTVYQGEPQSIKVLQSAPKDDTKFTRPSSVPNKSVRKSYSKPKVTFNYVNRETPISQDEKNSFLLESLRKNKIIEKQVLSSNLFGQSQQKVQINRPKTLVNQTVIEKVQGKVPTSFVQPLPKLKPGCTKRAEIKPVYEPPKISDCIQLTPEDIAKSENNGKKEEIFVYQKPGCTKTAEIKPTIQVLQPGCTKKAQIKPVYEPPQVSDCIQLTREDLAKIANNEQYSHIR